MITFNVTTKGLEETVMGLKTVRQERLPLLLKQIKFRMATEVRTEAIRETNNVTLRRRSGGLARHIARQKPEIDGTAVYWGLPTSEQHVQSRVGAFLERGGTVRPKGHPYLRVPTPAAMTRAGVDRFAGQKLRTVPGFFFYKTKSGKPSLARISKKGELEVWYMLKEFTTVKPHPWFQRAVEKASTRFDAIAAEKIRQAERER